jgi:hypothetical protein
MSQIEVERYFWFALAWAGDGHAAHAYGKVVDPIFEAFARERGSTLASREKRTLCDRDVSTLAPCPERVGICNECWTSLEKLERLAHDFETAPFGRCDACHGPLGTHACTERRGPSTGRFHAGCCPRCSTPSSN